MDCQKNITYLIKMVEYGKHCLKSKEKPKYLKKKIVIVQGAGRKKNIKGVALENKIGQQKLTCVDCDSKKPTF